MTAPPRMRGLPLIGLVPRMLRDPLALFSEARRLHGPVVRLDLGRVGEHYLVTDPVGVQEVLIAGKRREFPALRLLIDQGLVTLPTGDVWRGRRRLLQPMFSPRRLATLYPHIAAAVNDRLEARWRPAADSNTAIDLGLEAREIAFRVILQSMFGSALSADIEAFGRDLTTVLDFINVRVLTPIKLPLRWPLPSHVKFNRARADLAAIAGQLVARRRATDAEADDLLGLLLAARDEDTGAGLTDAQIHDEVLTMVLAGHETTATALTWTLWLLARHPEALATLRAEVDAVLAGRTPELADVAALTYTRKVLLESMRLYPPVWTTHRQFDAPHTICGREIPANQVIALCPWITHHLPEYWPGPDRFDPERFDPARSAGRPRHAYHPFAAGPHQCIGNEFALIEGVVALAMIVQRFEFALVDPGPVALRVVFTITPAKPIRLRLRPRGGLSRARAG